MAYREFIDADGVEWQAWEVIPSSAERRAMGERRFSGRHARDRRVRTQVRVRMDRGLAEGWLVFESAAEKRRLRPIPGGWSTLTDEQLAALVRSATTSSSRAIG